MKAKLQRSRGMHFIILSKLKGITTAVLFVRSIQRSINEVTEGTHRLSGSKRQQHSAHMSGSSSLSTGASKAVKDMRLEALAFSSLTLLDKELPLVFFEIATLVPDKA